MDVLLYPLFWMTQKVTYWDDETFHQDWGRWLGQTGTIWFCPVYNIISYWLRGGADCFVPCSLTFTTMGYQPNITWQRGTLTLCVPKYNSIPNKRWKILAMVLILLTFIPYWKPHPPTTEYKTHHYMYIYLYRTL